MTTAIGRAMEILGLAGSAFAEMREADINGAYRAMVKLCHPDTAHPEADRPEHSMAQLKSARALLLHEIDLRNRRCKLCDGMGKVPGRIGLRTCVSCGGKGVVGG